MSATKPRRGLLDDLRERRLEQTCRACGRWEAAQGVDKSATVTNRGSGRASVSGDRDTALRRVADGPGLSFALHGAQKPSNHGTCACSSGCGHGPMVPGKDWYRNGDLAERHGRCPVDVPASPPPEYRDDKRQWPVTWGPWPGVQRAPQEAQTPLKQPSDDTLGL